MIVAGALTLPASDARRLPKHHINDLKSGLGDKAASMIIAEVTS
jgi:hypothetical protein